MDIITDSTGNQNAYLLTRSVLFDLMGYSKPAGKNNQYGLEKDTKSKALRKI